MNIFLNVALLVFTAIVFQSCGGEQSSETNQLNVDSTRVVTIDASSSENFINSVIAFREEKEIETDGFIIEGKEIYANETGFKIINFKEEYEVGNFVVTYAIALNPSIQVSEFESGSDAFIQLPEMLTTDNINFSFYQGNFERASDFMADGAEDFILTEEHLSKNSINSVQKVIFFDGSNGLTTSNIVAKTELTKDGKIKYGQEEALKFKEKKDKPTEIELTHYQNKLLNTEDTSSRRIVEYTLTLKYDVATGQWQSGFIGDYSECKSLVSYFTKKRCRVVEYNNYYAMPQNCQNGGSDYFQLVKNKADISDFYVINDNEDIMATNVLVTIFEREKDFELVFLIHEDLGEDNTLGDVKYFPVFRRLYITKMEHGSDLEWHQWEDDTRFLYSDMPSFYELLPCDNY